MKSPEVAWDHMKSLEIFEGIRDCPRFLEIALDRLRSQEIFRIFGIVGASWNQKKFIVKFYAPRVPPRRRRTSNVRLPLELRSDRHETSATHVSDDLPISIFWRRTNIFSENKIDFVFRFFINFDRFSRSYAFSDVKIEFLEVFCFRWSNF